VRAILTSREVSRCQSHVILTIAHVFEQANKCILWCIRNPVKGLHYFCLVLHHSSPPPPPMGVCLGKEGGMGVVLSCFYIVDSYVHSIEHLHINIVWMRLTFINKECLFSHEESIAVPVNISVSFLCRVICSTTRLLVVAWGTAICSYWDDIWPTTNKRICSRIPIRMATYAGWWKFRKSNVIKELDLFSFFRGNLLLASPCINVFTHFICRKYIWSLIASYHLTEFAFTHVYLNGIS
jgi:hypothetical protein